MSPFRVYSQRYPESPGCTLMKDANGVIIIIGKANANHQTVKITVPSRGVKRALVDLPRQNYECRLSKIVLEQE